MNYHLIDHEIPSSIRFVHGSDCICGHKKFHTEEVHETDWRGALKVSVLEREKERERERDRKREREIEKECERERKIEKKREKGRETNQRQVHKMFVGVDSALLTADVFSLVVSKDQISAVAFH